MKASLNEYGLTPQQEKFCHCYVNEHANRDEDGSDNDIALIAYRMAYNCHADAKETTHKVKASALKNKDKIRERIKQIRAEAGQLAGIECADVVNRIVRALNVDPLSLLIYDEERGKYRLRYMHELPKKIRDVIPYKLNHRGILVPDINRIQLIDRLIRILGFEADKTVNVKTLFENGRITIGGFDDDDDV